MQVAAENPLFVSEDDIPEDELLSRTAIFRGQLEEEAKATGKEKPAAAIEREGFDLVVAGTESTDGSSGVVPQQIAELLNVPSLTFARKVEVVDDVARVEQQTAGGYDVAEASLPVLLAVTSGVVEPRYPTFKGIMQAKKKPIDTLTAADLGFTSDQVGDAGAGQRITSVTAVPAREAGEIVEDEGEAYLKIVALLEQAKVI